MKEALLGALASDTNASVDRILASTFFRPSRGSVALASVIHLSDRRAKALRDSSFDFADA